VFGWVAPDGRIGLGDEEPRRLGREQETVEATKLKCPRQRSRSEGRQDCAGAGRRRRCARSVALHEDEQAPRMPGTRGFVEEGTDEPARIVKRGIAAGPEPVGYRRRPEQNGIGRDGGRTSRAGLRRTREAECE